MSYLVAADLWNRIEVLVDEKDRSWFKRAHIEKCLQIKHIDTSLSKVNKCEMIARRELRPTLPSTGGWSGPKDQQNKTDIFLSEYALMHVIVNSKKHLAIELKEWLLRQVVPRGLNQMIEEKQLALEQKDTQLALKDETIREKDTQLALLSDDVATLEQENVELQHQVQDLQRRAVPRLEDGAKMNGIAVIQKNNGDDFPYVAICGQQGYVAQKIQNKLTDYPNGQLVVLGETGNAIVHYNWLRERGCIEVNPDRVRHFRLGEHYTHQRLMELQEA